MRARHVRNLSVLGLALVVGLGLASCGGDDDAGPNPATTGALNGTALDAISNQPIVGATATLVDLGPPKRAAVPPSVLTDANGSFRFTDVAPSSYQVQLDARTVLVTPGVPGVHYGLILLPPTVVTAGQNAVLSGTVYMPRVDDSQGTSIDGLTEVTVQPPNIGGFTLTVPAGSATFPDGGPSGVINVIEYPLDRSPTPLPDGLAPAFLFAIQPGGTAFNPPASITVPNREGLPANRELDIISLDPADGHFHTAVRGRVTADALYVSGVPETGEGGITEASLHLTACDAHVVNGCVETGTQQPVVGAIVEVLSNINTSSGARIPVSGAHAVTDAEGSYSIPGVRACNIWVRATYASASGSGTATSTDPVQVDDTGQTTIPCLTMEIQQNVVTFSVEGTVKTTGGATVAGADVYLASQNCKALTADPAGIPGNYTTTDGNGHFLLEGVSSAPEADFFVEAYQGSTNSGGRAYGNAPTLAHNGSTVSLGNVTICTPLQIEAMCVTAAWALTGDQLHITPDVASQVCDPRAFEAPDAITVQSLEDGVLNLEVVSSNSCGQSTETSTFQRVQGSGPTGISAANLPGVYARTAVVPADPGDLVILLTSGGDLGLIGAEDSQSQFVEVGSYTLSGDSLFTNPTYNSSDPELSSTHVWYSATASTLHVRNVAIDLTLTRCSSTAGGGLQGIWSGIVDNTAYHLLIGATEYAISGAGSTSPASAAVRARAAAVRRWPFTAMGW